MYAIRSYYAIFAMAALNYKRKDYSLADQYADRFLDQDHSSARAWKVKGLCSLSRRDSSGAIGPLSRSWHLGGGVSALFFLGQTFEAQGMVQEALTAYSRVLEDAPVMYPVLYAYARLASDQGQAQGALEKIDGLAGHDANPAVYYVGANVITSYSIHYTKLYDLHNVD